MKNKETSKGNLPYKDNKFESGQGVIQPENGQNSQKQQQQEKYNNKVIEQQQQSKKNKDSLNEEEINYEDGQKTSTDPQIYTTLDYYQNSSTKENCSGDNDDCTKPLYGHQGIPQQNEGKNWPYNQQQQQQLQQQQQENKNLMHDYNYNYNNNPATNKGVVNSTFNQLPSLGVFNNSSNNNQYEENGFHSSGNLMGIPNNYQQNGDNQINFTFQDDFFKDMGDKNYDVKIEPNFEDPNQIQGIKNLNQINNNGNGNGRSFTFNGNGGNGNTNHYYNPSQLQSTNSNDLQNAYLMDDFNQQQYQQPQQQQNGYLNQNNLLQNQNPLFMQYNLNEPQQINNNGNQMNNNNTNNNSNFFNQQQQLFYHNNNNQLQQQQQVQQQQHQQQQNQQEQRKRQKQDQIQSQKKQQSTETSSPTGNTTYNINTSSNETYQQQQKQQKQQQQQQQKKQKNKRNEDIIQEKFKEEYRTGSDQGLGYGSEGGELSEEQESKLIKKKIRKEKGYHKEYQKIDHNRQSCPSEYCRKFREKGVNTQSDKCPVYQQKLRSQKQQNSQRQRDDEKSYMAKFVIYTKALVNKLRRQGVDVDGEREVQELQEMGDNIVQRKKYQETVEKEKQNYIRIHGPQNLMNIAQFFLLMFVLAIGINSVVYVGVFQAAQYPIRINNRNLEEKDPKIGKYLNNYYFCRCYSKECSELDYLQVSQQNTDKEMNQNQYVQKQDTQENCEQKNDEKSKGIFYDNNKTHETCQKQNQEEQNSSSKFELQGLNTCALIKIQKKNNINSKIYKMKNNLQETKKLWQQKKQDKMKQKEK